MVNKLNKCTSAHLMSLLVEAEQGLELPLPTTSRQDRRGPRSLKWEVEWQSHIQTMHAWFKVEEKSNSFPGHLKRLFYMTSKQILKTAPTQSSMLCVLSHNVNSSAFGVSGKSRAQGIGAADLGVTEYLETPAPMSLPYSWTWHLPLTKDTAAPLPARVLMRRCRFPHLH